jgi:hypothetical protein
MLLPFALSIMAPMAEAKEVPLSSALQMWQDLVVEGKRSKLNCCADYCDCRLPLLSR